MLFIFQLKPVKSLLRTKNCSTVQAKKNKLIVTTAEHTLIYESATLRIKSVEQINREAYDPLALMDQFNKERVEMLETFKKERENWEKRDRERDQERAAMRKKGLFSFLDSVVDSIPVVGGVNRLLGGLF